MEAGYPVGGLVVSWDTSQLRSPLLPPAPQGYPWPSTSLRDRVAGPDNMPETMGFEPHT